jgi:predicted NBD/HSP70 family sugar kinase
MAQAAVLGIDIGGTKLAAGIVDPSGRVRSYVRAPTPTQADAGGLLAAVVALAERVCREGGTTPGAAGVGCGGPMVFPEGIVSPLHIPVWRGFPLHARLETALAKGRAACSAWSSRPALAAGLWPTGACCTARVATPVTPGM